MGRVDDAMRRAAGLTTRPEPEAAAAAALVLERDAVEVDPVEPDSADAEALLHHVDPKLSRKVVVDGRMMSASREQYRRLAASLHHAQAADGLKVVMIASAVPGEGKSLTASNLSLTLSESYRQTVLLIDADFRRPSLHKVFQLDAAHGLTDVLASADDRKLPLHTVSSHLTILPAGTPKSDPMAGLTSSRMRRVILEAREKFDWVIIDTPPTGLLTDANLLASMVDGTLLVVKAGGTPYFFVKRAVETIGADRILGVVLNRAATSEHRYGYGYGYYSHYLTGGGKTS